MKILTIKLIFHLILINLMLYLLKIPLQHENGSSWDNSVWILGYKEIIARKMWVFKG